jgi:hypothetical protein
MNDAKTLDQTTSGIIERTNARLDSYRQRTRAGTDRVFAKLLIGQWLFGIFIAFFFSPYTWAGRVSSVNYHMPIAIVFGGLIISVPVYLALKNPGATATRYFVAVAQACYSALLIHLTGGRIETHFHVFVSLAVLAFYLDLGVLVTAAAVVALDHFVRGLLWPESVYGITNPEWWRFLEHAFWVVLCVAALGMFSRLIMIGWQYAAEDAGMMEALAEQERRDAKSGGP